MSIRTFTDFLERKFSSNIASHSVLEPSAGEFESIPPSLDPRLAKALTDSNLQQLYSHQVEAFESIRSGRNTVLVSRTASGKTISFLLPILQDYLLSEAPFSVALMYPTKALSRDQEGTLGKLLEATGVDVRLGTFDGDTPREERTRIQNRADFMITNPDMLHSGILPNHNRKWRTFLSRLKYIVIDEVHTYRGAFGSHVANVLRRMIRVCQMHGSEPTFVCSSATIGNPQEHVRALFGREFQVITRDGAPRPQRDLYMINPPMVQSHGHAVYRKGPNSVSIPLIREATRLGVRTICFCRARQQVERLVRAVRDGHPELSSQVQPYRGGLLPNERRKLERDLAEGRVTTIVSTNALELGIDIGDLDLCILSGHPRFHGQLLATGGPCRAARVAGRHRLRRTQHSHRSVLCESSRVRSQSAYRTSLVKRQQSVHLITASTMCRARAPAARERDVVSRARIYCGARCVAE